MRTSTQTSLFVNKNYLLYLLLFISFGYYSQNPVVKKLILQPRELINDDWDTLVVVNGDLNFDRREDLVIVLRANFPVLEEEEDFGYIDTNERVLLIYFQDEKGYYYLNSINKDFILKKEDPYMEEPFLGMSISDKGVLSFQYFFWYSMGSWFSTSYDYKFRYQNNHFELIGFDSSEMHRATGESEDISINFSTRKMSTTISNLFDEELVPTETWKSFKLEKLYSLNDYGKAFSFQLEGVYF